MLRLGRKKEVLKIISIIKQCQRKMCVQIKGLTLKSVVKKLNEVAPLSFAQPWDNVGLLIEPPNKEHVHKMLLTIDLSLAVLEEAIEKNIDFILSYHPPIFDPLKKITTDNWKSFVVGECLSRGIAVYSPHTCYDALLGGLNDWLALSFGKGNISLLMDSKMVNNAKHHEILITFQSSNGDFANLFMEELLTLTNNYKYIMKKKEDAFAISMSCTSENLQNTVTSLNLLQAKFHLSFHVRDLHDNHPISFGIGRRNQLLTSITLAEAVERVKIHLGLSHVQLAVKHGGSLDSIIHAAGICAGAGHSVFSTITDEENIEVVLTGELRHHDVLDFNQRGISVILTNHTNSERGFLKDVLQSSLNSIFENRITVVMSTRDADPLVVM